MAGRSLIQGVWATGICEHGRQKSKCKNAEATVYEHSRNREKENGVHKVCGGQQFMKHMGRRDTVEGQGNSSNVWQR
jgi:hypothetical protein